MIYKEMPDTIKKNTNNTTGKWAKWYQEALLKGNTKRRPT